MTTMTILVVVVVFLLLLLLTVVVGVVVLLVVWLLLLLLLLMPHIYLWRRRFGSVSSKTRARSTSLWLTRPRSASVTTWFRAGTLTCSSMTSGTERTRQRLPRLSVTPSQSRMDPRMKTKR